MSKGKKIIAHCVFIILRHICDSHTQFNKTHPLSNLNKLLEPLIIYSSCPFLRQDSISQTRPEFLPQTWISSQSLKTQRIAHVKGFQIENFITQIIFDGH